jgi:SAM-dependent methyltransferase
VIGATLQIVGELLAEAADVRAGERVLDVAAGNGNASLAAARRFAHVISTDYVPQLLDKGAARARAEGLEISFEVADAESLPFADCEFDVVMSTFGAMFAPEHDRVARELLRVTRSGGRIGLANWTPEGFLGDLAFGRGYYGRATDLIGALPASAHRVGGSHAQRNLTVPDPARSPPASAAVQTPRGGLSRDARHPDDAVDTEHDLSPGSKVR